MAYCTIGQVQELIARINQNAAFSGSTAPTSTQVTDIMALVEAELDFHLAGAGFTVPITTPATLTAWLAFVQAEGSAARVLKSYAPESVTSPNGGPVIPGYSYYEQLYQGAIKIIDNREVSLDGSSMLARTYL